jgi:hypothetical protein
MATVESVKAKIRQLIDKANKTTNRRDLQLSPAFDALIEGYGRGDSGGIIDVTELPNISEAEEGVVYRLLDYTPPSADIYVGVNTGTYTSIMTLEKMFEAEGVTADVTVKIVPELPEFMDAINEATLTIPMYIIESTGIAYLSADGTSANVFTVGELFEGVDCGWISVAEQILPKEVGVMYFYSMRSEAKTEVKGLYLVSRGKWQLFKEIIDVEKLPTVNIKKNAIYRVGTYVKQDLYTVLAGGEIKPFLTWLEESNYADNVTFNKVEFVDSIPSPHDPTTAYVNASGLWIPDGNGGLTKWSNDDPLVALLFGQYYGLCDAEAVDLSKAGLYAVREGIIVDKYCVRSGGGWREFKIKSIFQEYVNGDLTELKPEDLSGIYRISDYALQNCKTLEKVTFSPSNGVIGDSAFEGCENLKEVVFHDTVLAIGKRAFYGCKSIEEIDWYSLRNLWDLYEQAFAYCTSLKHAAPTSGDSGGGFIFSAHCAGLFAGCTALETATIDFRPDAGWLDCSSMFSGCTSLHTFTDNVGMDYMPAGMFKGCSSLKDIYVPMPKAHWSFYEKGEKWDQGTPDYVIHCTDGDILKSDPESGSDDTPDEPVLDGAAIARSIVDGTITEYSDSELTSVADYGFYIKPKLTQVDLPNVTKIGSSAFQQCPLTSVNIPKVTRLGSYAFQHCTALQSIELFNLTMLEASVFNGCTSITSIDAPNVTTVGTRAFYNCNKATNINLPNATSLADYAFYQCNSLASIALPQVSSMNNYVFQYCENLKSVDLPKVQRIYGYDFASCYRLERLILRSETMTTLAATNAFDKCYHLHGTVHSSHNPNGDKDGYFYVPRALVDSYKSATNWSTFETQFRALEDYTVDGTTTGALDENKI